MKTFLFEGYYSPDDLARMLLAAATETQVHRDPRYRRRTLGYREAKRLLAKVRNESEPYTTEAAYILMAYALKKRLKCSDHTALKKLMGGQYRVLYDKLKARDQTLRQAARLVQNPPKKF